MSFHSDQEKQLITKFRSRVFDILKPGEDRSDQFLLRWIRAQDGNIEKAELMIRKSFDWRREYGFDDILYQAIDPVLMHLCPYSMLGLDTLGHPVVSFSIGRWDLARIVNEGREVEFVTHYTQLFEKAMERIRDSNKGRKPWEFQNTQFTAIADWAGYSYQQLVNFKVQLMLKLASSFDSHYPETLYKAFYINCPAIFPRLFAMLKPVMRDKTVARIKVYGTNRQEWEGKIKRLVHSNQLPPEYGGTAGPVSLSAAQGQTTTLTTTGAYPQ
ncbi:SEC14-like protein 2 isoform X2 [Folsomia candida]|uniref:SEC14-like protein 2 isoform X2 n=1 Tax=Folsomia candida TaxID=158441 RepID=UPI001604B757|nr:SEC14-like protein 2 isoform X2 [Folsomia candida]